VQTTAYYQKIQISYVMGLTTSLLVSPPILCHLQIISGMILSFVLINTVTTQDLKEPS